MTTSNLASDEDELQEALGFEAEGRCPVSGCPGDDIWASGVPIWIDGRQRDLHFCVDHSVALLETIDRLGRGRPTESDPDGVEAERYQNGVNLLQGMRIESFEAVEEPLHEAMTLSTNWKTG